MNQIAELLPEENVLLGLPAGSKPQLFDAIGQLFATTRGLSSAAVVDSLAARERLGSTGLGQGIAIPHGRIKGLTEAQGAYLRLATPIAFDAPDGKPVAQVFVLLVPEHATEQHLQLLSELAEMFSDRRFREALSNADSASGMHTLFQQWKSAA